MTQSTSMPTFTLTVNTTGCLLARRKPFLPPWQHGRKCLSGRTANSINCNKKLSYWVCAIKILSVSNSGVTISNPCWNQLQDFFGFKVKLPVEVASCVYSCTGINPWNDSSVNSFYFTLMVKRNLYDDKMTRGACTEKWFCSAVCSCLDLQKWCRRDLHLSWEKQWTALNACPDNAAGNTWHCLWTWASSTVSSAQTNTSFLMTDCMASSTTGRFNWHSQLTSSSTDIFKKLHPADDGKWRKNRCASHAVSHWMQMVGANTNSEFRVCLSPGSDILWRMSLCSKLREVYEGWSSQASHHRMLGR